MNLKPLLFIEAWNSIMDTKSPLWRIIFFFLTGMYGLYGLMYDVCAGNCNHIHEILSKIKVIWFSCL